MYLSGRSYTAAVSMLVGGDLTKVALLAGVEIALSVIMADRLGSRQKSHQENGRAAAMHIWPPL